MSTKHQCSESVPDTTGFGWYPCAINATIQHGETWYCWQHDPERKPRERKPTARQLYEQRRDADAKLGALVRAMPTNRNLTTDGLGTWRVYTDDDLLVGSGNTPEDALKVAGVVLGAVA